MTDVSWSFVLKTLIRESKRLKAIGENVAADSLEEDMSTVVTALHNFGKQHDIATFQAKRAEELRRSKEADNAYIKGQDE